jgi:hypothetical protein
LPDLPLRPWFSRCRSACAIFWNATPHFITGAAIQSVLYG